MKRLLAVLLVSASPLAADQVFLKGGGQLNGVVVQRTATSIVIDVAPGRVTLPASRVERVLVSTSALTTFRERADALAAGDIAGWLALAQWAEGRDLQTQARSAFEHVLAIDGDNAAARRALGQVQWDGHWLSESDAYRARGLVQVEGAWVTRAEQEAVLREREARAAESSARSEAGARVREAEARAEAAEAEARRAEAAGQTDGYGVPYGWVLGGGGCYGCGYGRVPARHPQHPVAHPTPRQTPAPPPPPASIGPMPPRVVH